MEATDKTTPAPLKRGLILEGGALRGLFTAGVMDVLMEQEIDFEGLVGVSAGAAFGCNFKSRQIGRVLRYNKLCAHDWRYCSLRSLVKTGELFGGEFCYHTLPDDIDPFDKETYEQNPLDFYAVCTDVMTGEPIYKHLRRDDYESREWIRASASMPLAAKIVEVGGRMLLDGGVADSIPLKFFIQKGYNRNLVVLTQPRGYVKTPNPLLPLVRRRLRDYPAFIRAMEQRPEMYNRQLAYLCAQEEAGTALVIAPEKTLPIKHTCHNPKLMDEVYQQGRQQTEQMLGQIKDFLNDKHA